MSTLYTTGTTSLTNGSAVVTGDGTAWETALIVGGVFYHGGNALPIESIDSNTELTLAFPWTETTVAGAAYAIIRDTAYDAQIARNADILARLLAGMEAGTIFKYNAEGDTAGRDFYDTRPKGFAYLDISVNPGELFVKASNTEADWAGPFRYATGDTGPAPNIDIGSVTTLDTGHPATVNISGMNPNYSLDFGLPKGLTGNKGWTIETELVADGPRFVVRVSDFIGGEGTKPAGTGLYVGVGGLVSDIADAVDVRGATGPQGGRGVDFRGNWDGDADYYIGDIAIDDDSGGNPATWISRTTNTNSRPRDNPSDWQYFPGSFPDTVNDGLWSDAITDTINDGIWGA